MKKIVLILMTLLLLFSCAAAESSYTVVIQDDADLLSAQEELELREVMEKIRPYGHVLFWTTKESGSGGVKGKARSWYRKQVGGSSGVLFLIDMKERQICIWSNGEILKTVTSAEGDNITDNVYRYASKRQYYECAAEAFTQVYRLLTGQGIARPMKLICNLLLSAALAALIVSLILKGYEYDAVSGKKWKKRREGLEEEETGEDEKAPNRSVTGLLLSRPGYTIRSARVTKIRDIVIDKSSSSGGSHGDGGGGGGGFSGGGGGGGGRHGF